MEKQFEYINLVGQLFDKVQETQYDAIMTLAEKMAENIKKQSHHSCLWNRTFTYDWN